MVSHIIWFPGLATHRCDKFGLVRRAALIIACICERGCVTIYEADINVARAPLRAIPKGLHWV